MDDSSSDEEFDLHEEEDIAMLVAMHKGKKPKHGGSVYGRAFIRRERIDAHKRLMRNYFGSPHVFPYAENVTLGGTLYSTPMDPCCTSPSTYVRTINMFSNSPADMNM